MAARMPRVVTFVDMRMGVKYAAMNMRVCVVVSPAPAQKQACRQKYDDDPDCHLRASKQPGRKPAREDQQRNSEGQQCCCMPNSPRQPEYARAMCPF